MQKYSSSCYDMISSKSLFNQKGFFFVINTFSWLKRAVWPERLDSFLAEKAFLVEKAF
jgi:hypothetical protein